MHRRGVLVMALTSAMLLTTTATSANAQSTKTPKFDPKDACSLPSPKEIKRLFGGAVTVQTTDPKPRGICLFSVSTEGDHTGGILWSIVEWRRGDPGPIRDPVAAVARAVDPDIAGGVNVEELSSIGKQAYLYPNDGFLYVVANKNFAFRLFWDTTPDSGQQMPLSNKDTGAMLDLARTIVKRAS